MPMLVYLSEGVGLNLLIVGLLAALAAVAAGIRRSRFRNYSGQILIPCAMIAFSILLLAITFDFPKEQAGPAVIPHLWIFWTIALSGAMLWRIFRTEGKEDPAPGRIGFLLLVFTILVGYYLALGYAGYFLSTFVFLVVLMHLLSYGNKMVIYGVAGGWTVFCYIVFYRMLHIQLPLGFFENFF